MDGDTESTNTSIEDKTEDFCDNPTRDALTEGLMCLLKPTIDQLDERVRATRISQIELKQQIDGLAEEIKRISDEQQCPLDLENYVKKLLNAKRRITVVSNILQVAQERLNKVHQLIERESARRKALTEPSPVTSPSTVAGELNPSIQQKDGDPLH
ncbi:SNAPIN protein homolog [Cloeon dipterum]|uniref:SNAPIN protein homolog n=1 Tax=Cloeon dipterum TaxID=197152 RepID=UPI00321F91A0